MSTHLTAAPLSSAAANHGAMLASWSRRVTITSAPGPRGRAIERDSDRHNVVMLGPNTTSSGEHPRRSAPARRASEITLSVAALVAKAPPALALLRSR